VLTSPYRDRAKSTVLSAAAVPRVVCETPLTQQFLGRRVRPEVRCAETAERQAMASEDLAGCLKVLGLLLTRRPPVRDVTVAVDCRIRDRIFR
jgi:hypothetical protein